MTIPTNLRALARTAMIGTLALVAVGTAAVFAQEAAPAAPAVPIPDKGDTAWMLVSTILVIMMTIPGLALFYGGLVRAKNMLSILMQVLAGFSMVALLWVIYGYSLAFSGAGTAEEATALTPFIGGLSKMFLSGVGPASLAETFTQGVWFEWTAPEERSPLSLPDSQDGMVDNLWGVG